MRASGLIAMALAVTATGTVKDGVDAWQRGSYGDAVRIWRPIADRGDPDAAFDLAQAYKLGRGVPADLITAEHYYGLAARAGHMEAAANYGLLLFQGGRRKQAMPWIEKAADAGDPRAQYVLGTALFNGDYARQDQPRAYALMSRAAAAGLPQATTSLAQMEQVLSPAERRKGTALASEIAARPMPPIGRQSVTAPSEPRLASAGTPPRIYTIGGEPSEPARALPALRAAAPAKTAPPKPVRAAPPAAHPAPAARPAPAPRAAPAARPAPAPTLAHAGGRWQVQLGAYGSPAAAAVAWREALARAPGLRGLQPSYQKAGPLVRLRVGPLADKPAAARACAAASAAHLACFPVAP